MGLLLSVAAVSYGQLGSFGISAAIIEEEVPIVTVSRLSEDPGTIYVFLQDENGEWARMDEVTSEDETGAALFGYFIRPHGGQVFIGVPSEEAGQGAIHVWGPDAYGDWGEQARITGDEGDDIGATFAIDDGLIVSGGLRESQHLTAFALADGAWTRVGTLSADSVGYAGGVAMDANYIYAGAPLANEGTGAVHVFSREDYSLQATLLPSDDTVVSLGVAVLPLGDGRVWAGAPGLQPNMAPQAPPPPGAVVEFAMADGEWNETATFRSGFGSTFDAFGLAMAEHSGHIYVGALLANQFQGRVIAYAQDDTGAYSGVDTLSAEGAQGYGLAMAHSGDLMVVTSAMTNQVGAAHIYRNTDGAWTLEGTVESGVEPPEPPEPVTAGIEMVSTSERHDCAESMARDFGCDNVDLLAFMPTSDVGGAEGVTASDIWGWTDPETGKEYALLGRSDGTAFIDISTPAAPVYLGNLSLTEGANPNVWRDIKVFSNHAFIVADGAGEHGMQVFDLTQLRDLADVPAEFTETAIYRGIHSAHNIVINEDTGFAYAVGSSGGGDTCGGGLHMVDISDPANPVFAGCFAHEGTGRAGTGYSHDAQCVIYHGPDAEHAGKEICLGSNETVLSIADVTDKENTVVLSAGEYPDVGYGHQGWLTDDHRFFYMNDELDELQGLVEGTRTLVWDLADLDDPQLVTQYYSGNPSSDHNLYVRGDLMYQSNYSSGLRIFDITDRANPVPVGHFDTFPAGEDEAGFNGSWSNYPFFESGIIIVSSMGEGFFVVKQQSVDI